MFELHERMPGMWSTDHEYQTTMTLKFFIIIHNYVNVRQSTNQNRVVSDITGQHQWPVNSDVAERRKWLEAIGWISG